MNERLADAEMFTDTDMALVRFTRSSLNEFLARLNESDVRTADGQYRIRFSFVESEYGDAYLETRMDEVGA